MTACRSWGRWPPVGRLAGDETAPLLGVEDEGYRIFGGYIEPGDDGWDPLLEVARDRVLDKLVRARSRDAQLCLAVEAAVHGLVVEAEDGDDGGWAA